MWRWRWCGIRRCALGVGGGRALRKIYGLVPSSVGNVVLCGGRSAVSFLWRWPLVFFMYEWDFLGGYSLSLLCPCSNGGVGSARGKWW